MDVGDFRRIVILTGAGLSVASGLRPYRGPGGLWSDEDLVRLSHAVALRSEPLALWRHWWGMRKIALAASPNAAHLAIARFEASRGEGRAMSLITQNVDGLHSKAGSASVVEFHGNALRTRCSRRSCALESFEDQRCEGDAVPLCPLCGSILRPDIVLFGESIPPEADRLARRALRDVDLFIAVGTSGTVQPAALFAAWAARAGARTVWVNLEPYQAQGPDIGFDEQILGRAEEVLPELLGGS
jgi:NAD-dependent deacetylase